MPYSINTLYLALVIEIRHEWIGENSIKSFIYFKFRNLAITFNKLDKVFLQAFRSDKASKLDMCEQ